MNMNKPKFILLIGEDGSMKGYNNNAFMRRLEIEAEERINNP